MKTGKLPENVLKRAVFRQLDLKREDVISRMGVGVDSAVLKAEPDEAVIFSSDPVIWQDDSCDGKRTVFSVCNDLACTGARPVGLLLTALLPVDIQEIQIRTMVKKIAEVCEPMGIQILGGHTEITPAVNRPVISVTGVGKAKEQNLISSGGAKAGDDILVTKWIGLEGTFRIARRKEDELAVRYPLYMIREAASYDRYLSVLPEAEIAVEAGVHSMHDISEGGIFGALWELAESSGTGLEIYLKKIPIRQETVEICNFYGLNPYQLVSGGSMLMAAADGNGLVHRLEQAGIPAVIIGRATEGNDRVILNGEEKRFLDLPQADEIHKIISDESQRTANE